MVVVGLYFVISVTVLILKITGRLKEGLPMYFDTTTPAYSELLLFQVASVAVLLACLYLRGLLKRNAPGH